MQEKRNEISPLGVLFPSELVSQYRCMKLSKTDDNDRTRKMMQILYLDISSMLPSGQHPRTNNLSHLFWNTEDPVLVETLTYRRKIT